MCVVCVLIGVILLESNVKRLVRLRFDEFIFFFGIVVIFGEGEGGIGLG